MPEIFEDFEKMQIASVRVPTDAQMRTLEQLNKVSEKDKKAKLELQTQNFDLIGIVAAIACLLGGLILLA